jgi:RNA polymerase sigma factor (sigma-70 family)
VAFLICRDQSRADDAAAEAIARVWQRSLAGGIEDVRPYLYRTLVNLVTKGRRQFRSEQRAFGRHARFSTRSEIGEAVADRTDVGRALRTLSPEQRAVIVLRYFEGLSEDEIATALGISPGTVKSRASRGLSTLRVALRGDNGD